MQQDRLKEGLKIKFYLSTVIILLLLFTGCREKAPIETGKGWEYWTNGDIPEAQSFAEGILKKAPDHNNALHLRSLCLLVQGRYREAIATFSRVDTDYEEYGRLGEAIVDAYFHLNEPHNALKLAGQLKSESVDYYQKLAARPFTCNADKTFIIEFIKDLKIPSEYWPAIPGKINGKNVNIRLDTGGAFLGLGRQKAQELGIEFDFEGTGMHGATEVKTWQTVVDKLELGQGLVFRNVPVVIMASISRSAIIGTNILEQFLTTIDYPNSRFILTPRRRKDLYPAHLALLPKSQEKLPFYLWSDHYMFAKGSFNNIDGQNFFFDSGLVALMEVDGKLHQAAFNVSREKLISLGFDETRLDRSNFFRTKFPLSVQSLTQQNTLLWYDKNLEEDMNFGGVRIDGLISHAFLSKYSWTIDFDRHEYIFGIH